MKNAQDFAKTMQDMFGAFPMNADAAQDMFKNTAALTEKMSKVALEAAEKSTEISAKWANETLTKLGDASKAKTDPAEISEAVSSFASNSAEMAAENMAAFAEVAKKVQMETVELLMSAGKDLSEEASSAVKKATTELKKAAK